MSANSSFIFSKNALKQTGTYQRTVAFMEAFGITKICNYTVSQKNWATFIFTVTLANVGRFLKFFQCRNQKEMAHNMNEKFPTVD